MDRTQSQVVVQVKTARSYSHLAVELLAAVAAAVVAAVAAAVMAAELAEVAARMKEGSSAR